MRRSILLISAGFAAIALAACQDNADTAADDGMDTAAQTQGDMNAGADNSMEDTSSDDMTGGNMADTGVSFPESAYDPVAKAVFQFSSAVPDAKGEAQFFWDERRLKLHVKATGLPPGAHGIHIHSVGDCSAADFTSSSGHIGKGKAQHGLDNPDGPEAGDLKNLMVDKDGVANQTFGTRVLLSGKAGNRPKLLDEDGSAIIIHEAKDDQSTQPIGGAGARIACGVVEAVPGAENVAGQPVEAGDDMEMEESGQ